MPLLSVGGASLAVFACTRSVRRPAKWRAVFLSAAAVCLVTSAGELCHLREARTGNGGRRRPARYLPFCKDAKLARLDGVSALRLSSPLSSLDGATALFPLYAAFVNAAYPEAEYALGKAPLFCSTTSKAYDRLLTGEVDVIFCAVPSDYHREQAWELGVALNLHPVGKEAFVFFVNHRNRVGHITSADIRGVYSGRITDWKELGGARGAIRAFQRLRNSGSQTALEALMGHTPLMTSPKRNEFSVMDGIIRETAEYRNGRHAIGYSFLHYATRMARDRRIKLLAVDGVMPSREAIHTGAYPLADEFYAVIAGEESGNVRRLIEWLVFAQGQELMKKTG